MLQTLDFNLDDLFFKNFINLSIVEDEQILEWRNDYRIRNFMKRDEPITAKEHGHFILDLKKSEKNRYWLIYKDKEPLGVVYVTDIDKIQRHAWYGMYIIPGKQNNGFGTYICKKAINYLLTNQLIHTLKLEVLSTNTRALKMYKNIGFIQEGELKDYLKKDGKFIDLIIMGKRAKEKFLF